MEQLSPVPRICGRIGRGEFIKWYRRAPRSGNWQLTTGNRFSKSFPGPHTERGREDTTISSSYIADTAAGLVFASTQVTLACDVGGAYPHWQESRDAVR